MIDDENLDEISISASIQNETKVKELHPCQYCENLCYGHQCKSCHFKMLEKREGVCIQCNTTFQAMRKNGTLKKRCFECQDKYNKKYIAKCITCNKDFHAFLDDGRVFDKCLSCYKNGFKQCEKCDNNTREEFSLCKECYKTERENEVPRVL